MARNAPKTSMSQHLPSLESNVDSQFSMRVIADPNTSDSASRKKLKSCQSAQRNSWPSPHHRQLAPMTSDLPQTVDPHILSQGAPGCLEATLPNRMPRQQQAGGEPSSDRRDWAQPTLGKAPLSREPWMNPSSPESSAPIVQEPLLTQHAPWEKTSKVDNQNITSLSRDNGSERGQKRRLSVGEAEAEFDQKRLLDIVQELDRLEKEQKDFGKQQLQAIKEGFV